jgi:hypothetical protein
MSVRIEIDCYQRKSGRKEDGTERDDEPKGTRSKSIES